MIRIGLFVGSTKDINNLTDILEENLNVPPYRYIKGQVEFFLPLLHITIIPANCARGHRFDLIYYDAENISKEILDCMISPCCLYARPRSLKEFLFNIGRK